MSYTNEQDAFGVLTAVAHGGTTLKGVLGFAYERTVQRLRLFASGTTYPVARPIASGGQDLTATVKLLDGNSIIADTTAAATLTATFKKGNTSNTGTVALSNMVPGTSRGDSEGGRGMEFEQVYELEGAATANITQ